MGPAEEEVGETTWFGVKPLLVTRACGVSPGNCIACGNMPYTPAERESAAAVLVLVFVGLLVFALVLALVLVRPKGLRPPSIMAEEALLLGMADAVEAAGCSAVDACVVVVAAAAVAATLDAEAASTAALSRCCCGGCSDCAAFGWLPHCAFGSEDSCAGLLVVVVVVVLVLVLLFCLSSAAACCLFALAFFMVGGFGWLVVVCFCSWDLRWRLMSER